MPIPVAAWVDDTFPTATSLNLAMYTSNGSGDHPTGVAFASYRPILFESYGSAATIHTNTSGSQSSLSTSGTVTAATVLYDTAGFFGAYTDQPATTGYYEFTPAVNGSAGDGVTAGGWTLLAHFAAIAHKSTQTSVSADLLGTNQTPVSGTRQIPSSSLDSTAFFLDLVNVGGGITWSPAVTVADSGSNSTNVVANATDSSGETCRFLSVWAAVSATTSGQAVFTTAGSYPFTCPAGVTSINTTATGSGAGGGSGNSLVATYGGGGGGGGQIAIGAVSTTPLNDYVVEVGAGGGPSNPGNPSSFAGDVSNVTAEGGSAGGNATTSADGAGGAGGTGGTGTTRHAGGAGAAGATNSYGGGGGSSAGTSQAGTSATSSSGAPAPAGGGPGGSGGVESITIVQSAHFSSTTTNFLTCTMPSPFQTGSTVLAFVYYQAVGTSSTDPTVTLSDGTAMSQQQPANVTSTVNLNVALYDTYNISGGQTGISLTGHGTSNGDKAYLVEVYEVAGLGASPTIDPASSSHTQGPSHPDAFYQNYSGSPGTTATAPQLWVAMTGAQSPSGFNIYNPPKSQDWITDSPRYVTSSNGDTRAGILTAHQVVTSTGSLAFSGGGPHNDGFSQGVTKGTLAIAYQPASTTTGSGPPIGPGGGGGGGLGAGNAGGSGYDGQVILTWTAPSGSGYGTPALPAPYSTWSDSTTVGTSNLVTVNLNGNTGPGGTLNFLSNPPCFRISQEAATSMASSAITTVPFTGISPTVDSYTGWNAATSSYVVQRSGLYLFHGLVAFTNSVTGSVRIAAVNVTPSGGSVTSYWGPPSPPATVLGTHVAKTQILDLQAGDTVALAGYCGTSGSVNLSTTSQTRFLLAFLCETGLPAGTWSPPDTTFRWQSGTKPTSDGGNLTEQFQQHMGNDLGFLVNRPYLTAWQNAAQSGIAANTYTTLTLGAVKGYIHSSDNGDNYSGWSSGSNSYAAQAAGWYLVCAEAFAAAPSIAGATVGVAVLPSTSGGVTPSQTPDIYQQLVAPNGAFWGGAGLLTLQYLNVGETIALQIAGNGYTGSFSSIIGAHSGGTMNSHLEAVWCSS